MGYGLVSLHFLSHDNLIVSSLLWEGGKLLLSNVDSDGDVKNFILLFILSRFSFQTHCRLFELYNTFNFYEALRFSIFAGIKLYNSNTCLQFFCLCLLAFFF